MSMNMSAVLQISAAVTGAQAIDELNRKVGALNGAAHGAERGFSAMAEGVKNFFAIEIVSKLTEFTSHLVESADQMNDLSKKTGITVEELSKFQGAADSAGTNIEGVATGMKKLSVNALEAVSGNRQLAAVFNALGVSIKDANGHIRSSGDMMLDIADAFNQMEDGPVKAAAAVKIFGKAGADLIPMLNDGSDSIKKFASTMSSDVARQADEFHDRLDLLKRNTEAFGYSIIGKVLPSLNYMGEHFGKVGKDSESVKDSFLSLETVTNGIGYALRGIVAAAYLVGSSFLEAARDAIAFGEAAWSALKFDFSGAKEIFNQRAKEQRDFNEILTETKNILLGINDAQAAGANSSPESSKKDTITAKVSSALGSATTDKLDEFLDNQRQAVKMLQAEALQATMTAGEYKAYTDQLKFADDLRKLEIQSGGALTDSFKKRAQAIEDEKVKLIRLNEEYQKSFSGGLRSGLNEIKELATDVGGSVKNALVDAFKGAEDAFVNFVKTGKLDFKSLIDTIIADLARLAFKNMISGLFGGGGGIFSSIIGSIFGGSTGGSGGIGHNALGTDNWSGGMTWVGENGPELINLPKGAQVVPNHKLGASTGNMTQHVTLNFAPGVSPQDLQQVIPHITEAASNLALRKINRGALNSRA